MVAVHWKYTGSTVQHSLEEFPQQRVLWVASWGSSLSSGRLAPQAKASMGARHGCRGEISSPCTIQPCKCIVKPLFVLASLANKEAAELLASLCKPACAGVE